jgi:hypothetical protein
VGLAPRTAAGRLAALAYNRTVGPDGFLDHGRVAHLSECLGQASEILDAEAPYTPRGCVAQAWSVAELIRCLVTIAPS